MYSYSVEIPEEPFITHLISLIKYAQVYITKCGMVSKHRHTVAFTHTQSDACTHTDIHTHTHTHTHSHTHNSCCVSIDSKINSSLTVPYHYFIFVSY